MKLSAVSACALFGGIASAYGMGIALMPLITGLFRRDASQLIADARAAKVVQTLLQMSDALSMRMFVACSLALVLFGAIAYIDRQTMRRRGLPSEAPL